MIFHSCINVVRGKVENKHALNVARAKLIVLLFSFISLLFASNVHSDQHKHSDQIVTEYKLLVLGDSLSAAYGLSTREGWVSLLAQKWEQEQTNIAVINAAISGDTTDGGLARLPRLIELHQPTHLYIELGGNNGLQGHNPKKIKQNLIEMIEIAQAKDITVILQEINIPTNYGARYTKSFNAIFHDLSKEYSVALVPFFLQEIALQPDLMQNDGIHPTKQAQPLIVEFMAPKLLDAIKN